MINAPKKAIRLTRMKIYPRLRRIYHKKENYT